MSKRKHNSDKNEFALQEENELLKKTLNAINSGIVIADKNGNVLYVNDAANHPVSKKLRKHQASAWPDIFNLKRLDNTPVSYEEMPMIRTLKTGKPHSEDLIVLNHKKEKIILNVNAKPIFDNKKKLSGVMVAYHDITELKQREAELKNALQDKQLLFTAIETTSDIVAVTDFYGRLMYFNKAARNALNPRNVKDISKIKVKDYHSPESWQKLRHEMIPQAIKNGSATGELTFIKKSGEEVYVSQVLVCKKDAKGKVEFFASISRDISALIAKEELVKKQQAYIQNILDANPSPIFVKDIDGTYSFVNKKYCEFTGLPLSEIISKTDVKVYGKNKTTLRYRKEDKKVITENATLIINEEKYFDKHEKKEKWFQTIKTPIKSIDGKKTQVLGVASDITGLKEAETILKRQLELNEVISNISTEFLNSHFNEIDKVMVNALKTICRNTTMTRATINVTSKDKKIKYLHVWSQHKEDPLLKGFFLLEKYKVEDFKWISNQLKEKGYAFSGDMKKLSKSSLEKKVLSGTEIPNSSSQHTPLSRWLPYCFFI
jgi:PAS domain S-box-containing protein